jgi:hypothetical protein
MANSYLEIGMGASRQSAYDWANKTLPIKVEDSYLAVDLPLALGATGYSMTQRWSMGNKIDPYRRNDEGLNLQEVLGDRYIPVFADAQNLPIKTNSIHEVVMENVIGDPGITESVRVRIVTEAIRVLKHKGSLYVLESYSPEEAAAIIQSYRDFRMIEVGNNARRNFLPRDTDHRDGTKARDPLVFQLIKNDSLVNPEIDASALPSKYLNSVRNHLNPTA